MKTNPTPTHSPTETDKCICAWWGHCDSEITTESVIPMPGCPIHTDEGRRKA